MRKIRNQPYNRTRRGLDEFPSKAVFPAQQLAASTGLAQGWDIQKMNALKQAQENCARALAEELWLTSSPIGGTLAEIYLRETLGLVGPLPDILGFHEKTLCPVYDDYTPSLVCPIYDRGAVVAVHQTFLCAETLDAWRTLDGRPVTEVLGSLGTGAAWLGCPDTVLGLTVGVEPALALSKRFSLPVWAVCEAQRFPRVWTPPEIEELVIFADSDKPGRDAASKAVDAFSGRMRVVVQFAEDAKDFADLVERRIA